MSHSLNIIDFARYLNIESSKSDDIHIVQYESQSEIRLQSKPIHIDFYLLAIKKNCDNNLDFGQTAFDKADYYLYFDAPDKTLSWDLKKSLSGYNILISKRTFSKYAKDYNFMHYHNHEALFVNKEEEVILLDLFKKAYSEYNKNDFSKEIVISYASLILTYIHNFYKRQFETRSKLYNKVVADFYEHLEDHFDSTLELIELPSVSYFAQKANLSSNYFGDVIKHFTGNSAQSHIHQHIIQLAKNKLRQSSLTISEIAYSLGFDYPTYFTRFFKKETGITPTVFRNQ